MGHVITERYGELFDRRVRNSFLFIYDVYKSGKLRELVSFAVWELFHRLGLFPKQSYLKFSKDDPLAIDNERLETSDFGHKMEHCFKIRGLRLTRVDHNWKLLFLNKDKKLFGCIYPDDRDLYESHDKGRSIDFIERFPSRIRSIFISSQNTIFVCVEGAVYMRSDRGNSFKKSLDLGSSISFFRHNNGMTELPDGTLIIGEYGNIWGKDGWRQLAYLYYSSDGGNTWERSDFLINHGTNKHVHIVKYSKLFDTLFMADGDNYKRLWVFNSPSALDLTGSDRWRPVNRFHIQIGGHTSVVEDDEQILFGTDYQGGTNFLVHTKDGKKFHKRIVPDPYRRSPLDNMILRNANQGNEIWANLPFSTSKTRCLLMFTRDCGENWSRVIEYNRADKTVWLISSAHSSTEDLYFSIKSSKTGERIVYRVSD